MLPDELILLARVNRYLSRYYRHNILSNRISAELLKKEDVVTVGYFVWRRWIDGGGYLIIKRFFVHVVPSSFA